MKPHRIRPVRPTWSISLWTGIRHTGFPLLCWKVTLWDIHFRSFSPSMCKSQKFSTVFPHRMFSTFPPYVEIVEKSVISFIYHVFLSTVFPQQAACLRNVFHFSTIWAFHMIVFHHFFFHRWWKTLNCLIFIADFSTFPVENLVDIHFPSVVFHKFVIVFFPFL